MGLDQKELAIVTIKELFDKNKKLKIPEYQRPYRWSKESVLTLFNDLYNAYKTNPDKEYRIGTVILCHIGDEYEIVDGQQRITTLALLFLASGIKIESNILKDLRFNKLSFESLYNNHIVLKNKFNNLPDNEKESFIDFIKAQCTMVKIVISSIDEYEGRQEAFQFFDSQNTRGKSLDPHDLLKSYHLREMNSERIDIKLNVINEWENTNQNELVILFREYLYPITQWYRYKNGLGYSSKNIDAFKGIKLNNIFNYAIYHKASNLFIEQTNNSGTSELISSEPLNQFQLTQPIVAGKRFFKYVSHYKNLIENIKNTVDIKIKNLMGDNEKNYLPQERTGDSYVYKLFLCAVIFFVDKFGLNELNDSVIKKIYVWAYSLRINMLSVYPETINKYALGYHDRVQNGNIFAYINEMKYPQDLDLLIFKYENIHKNEEKYNKIMQCLKMFAGDKNE